MTENQHKAITAREARANEGRRLEALVARIQKTAEKVSVAASYHDDGAYQTARDRIEDAIRELRNHGDYLANNRWHVVEGGEK